MIKIAAVLLVIAHLTDLSTSQLVFNLDRVPHLQKKKKKPVKPVPVEPTPVVPTKDSLFGDDKVSNLLNENEAFLVAEL
jgi:hypothetical protein